jgi:glycosyltransferase involved in cell wall biosynthesis
MPKVSVILPVYNGARFIAKAITSILDQTFRNFEFIIIDDGSTDKTVSIINSFRDNRIILLRNSTNLGIVESLNKGIRHAQGDYVCRMDADDISMESRFDQQVKYLENNQNIAVVGSQIILIDECDLEIGKIKYPITSQEIRRSIFIHNPFAHGATMIRARVLSECGLYDQRYLHNEDYDLWLRIGTKYRLANLSVPLLKRRIHISSITMKKENELVKYRLRTLHNAIINYYRNPICIVYLVRPMLAYCYRIVRQWISI